METAANERANKSLVSLRIANVESLDDNNGG